MNGLDHGILRKLSSVDAGEWYNRCPLAEQAKLLAAIANLLV